MEILTEGFRTPNGRAFLFPFIAHRRALAESHISVALRQRIEDVRDGDFIVVDSKYLRDRWASGTDGIFAELESLKRGAGHLVYADTGDSAGWLQPHVLPFVDFYWKSMLLRDRQRYLQPMYGHRAYTDYYHRKYGVQDAQPQHSTSVDDVRQLAKLRLGWNSALADYSWLGPYRMSAYQHLPLSLLLRPPRRVTAPSVDRPIELHCRMGLQYPRASVGYQRTMIAKHLAERVATGKVSRRRYINELEWSKLVLSPFGFGEITLKDFESFLAGALLLKPDMHHVETWPDLFRAGETMVTHDWDLTDLEAVIDRVLTDYPAHLDLARQGQRRYLDHLVDPRPFIEHLLSLVGGENAVAEGKTAL